jgi:diguanylate cyclase (GGDEF)-like protein
VNDTLGHPVGDRLLQAVAGRLRSTLRENDLVARLGGDEFAIIQDPVRQPGEAGALAERIIAVLAAPYELDGHQINIGASVGIALAPSDGSDASTLLQHADMALYRAKDDGRGMFRYFQPAMDARVKARRALELDLRQALAGQQFALHYQPVIGTAHGGITGFEALLRWHHPVRGTVPPSAFVPLAEEIGLIGPIGEWVLRQACHEAVSWPGALRVAINVSAAQFKGQKLVGTVVSALATSGLPPDRLELEVTEAVLLRDGEINLQTLHQLKTLGVRISMDDFGTGYSSLGYLRSFPFDTIKIDQCFVRDLPSNPGDAAIVRAITGLAASLGMSTTAEGVETEDQLAALKAEGCTEAQGYLISRPVPPDQVAEVLARRQ